MEKINWINYSAELIEPIISEEKIIRKIEQCYRVCYNSNMSDNIDDSIKFIMKYKSLGHMSPFEHESLSVKCILDRGLSHEIVRHRLAAYNQTSTRYCKYSDYLDCILPSQIKNNNDLFIQNVFIKGIEEAYNSYLKLLELGVSPQNARGVLPTCTATTLIITSNIRNWYHIFNERYYNKGAHPDIRILMSKIYKEFNKYYPHLFDNYIEL